LTGSKCWINKRIAKEEAVTLKEEMLREAKAKNEQQKRVICAQAAVIAALLAAVIVRTGKSKKR
jgi:hypothetical protein